MTLLVDPPQIAGIFEFFIGPGYSEVRLGLL